MTLIKFHRAVRKANIASKTCPTVVEAIIQQIPADLIASVTSTQLALIVEAVHASYHAGRSSTGAEMLDDGAVWVHEAKRIPAPPMRLGTCIRYTRHLSAGGIMQPRCRLLHL